MSEICLVMNPTSGGGAAARRVEEVRTVSARCLPGAELWLTEGPGHASQLALRAAARGARLVVAVGGDGTANEVVNGLFDGGARERPAAAFGLIHMGTGGDLVKSLHMPPGLEEAMARIRTRPWTPCDVLRVQVRDPHTGEPVVRMGINVTGFGMNGEVVRRANQGKKRFGGKVTFLHATLRALVAYTPVEVRVGWVDGAGQERHWQGVLSSAFVANGQFCGGGMWVGRGGQLDDGLAELTVIPDLPPFRMVLGLPKLFGGTIGNVKNVSTSQISRLWAEAVPDRPVLVDVDGEQPGILPIEIRVVEKVLDVAGL